MKAKYIIFTLIILLVGCSKKYSYKSDIQTAFKQNKELNIVAQNQIEQILKDTSQKNILVDIRTVRLFGQGRLPNAINIPLKDLYNNLKFFFLNRDKNIFIYAENTSQAATTVMFINSLGLNNVKALGGGYKFLYENYINKSQNADSIYFDETPKYNYATKFKELSKGDSSTSTINTNQQPSTPVVIPTKQTKKTGLGGCG